MSKSTFKLSNKKWPLYFTIWEMLKYNSRGSKASGSSFNCASRKWYIEGYFIWYSLSDKKPSPNKLFLNLLFTDLSSLCKLLSAWRRKNPMSRGAIASENKDCNNFTLQLRRSNLLRLHRFKRISAAVFASSNRRTPHIPFPLNFNILYALSVTA